MQKPLILFLLFLCFSCKWKEEEVSSKREEKMNIPANQPSINIEGVYVVFNEPDEAEKCAITITIQKAGEEYNYKFKTESRSLVGKVSLELNEDKDGYYITFEGIEWSEYEGELVMDKDGDYHAKEELELPVGINGLIQENQITIQNYGNSMNSYTQLGECGKKYIILKKQVTSAEASLYQDECFDKSAFGLPYNQKNLPIELDYKTVKCDLNGTNEFLCDGPLLRYIPLPDFKNVKVVLVPMDCGDFNHRFFLLTFVNKKVVANQYVEGEWYEPGAEQNHYLDHRSMAFPFLYLKSARQLS
jgi:hypothetical protein